MRLALVLNRSAGSFRRLAPDATARAIEDVLTRAGHTVETRLVGRRALPAEFSALAARGDLDAVVVGGGDGTILAAIRAGLGQTLPLGLLPLGTLNLFARDLGLPTRPLEAAARLAAARPAAIDLAQVNGLPFGIWASVGLHPWAVRRRDHLQRDGMGKTLAMAIAALRAFWRFERLSLRIRWDGGETTCVTPLLVVSNNAWRDQTPPLQREALDAGTIEVHVAACPDRRSLLLLALEALLGRWRGSRRIRTLRTGEAHVACDRRRLLASLDGEVEVVEPPLHFRTRPGALKVLMPGPEGGA